MFMQNWSRIGRIQARLSSIRAYASWEGRGRSNAARSNTGTRFDGRNDSRAGRSNEPRFGGRRDDSRPSFNRFNNSRPARGGNAGRNWGRGQGSRSRRFDDSDDTELMARTHGKHRHDDGLMGLPDYELATDLSTLQWTDLVPKDAAAASEPPAAGFSKVPTQALADHRLLSRPLVNSLLNRKYEWLTPVQAQTILPILRSESCVVRAKTGTGKTAAFSIPAIQKALDARRNGVAQGKVKALIITPTRELAQQIADEVFKITNFGGVHTVKVQSLVGGLSKHAQMRASGLLPESRDADVADIIVATPGRLKDVLLESGVPERFSELQFRVFDEADRILDIGFERTIDEVRDIIDSASEPGRSTPLLLFSATADRTVRQFAQSQFGDRVYTVDTVPKNEPTANELVDQVAIVCRNWAEVYEGAAREVLASYQKAQDEGSHFKAIVFLPTTTMVDHFKKLVSDTIPYKMPLRKAIFNVHGQRSQASRQRSADDFRKLRDSILITTDVVARGMDFPFVSHVFQLGIPPDVSSYVHRIGRTARIGNRGTSYLFYTHHVRAYIDALAREGIKPATKLFEPEEEFHNRFLRLFAQSVAHEENVRELVHSLLSYMTVVKAKYRVDANEFMRDMVPFAELMGMSQVPMSNNLREVWMPRRRTPPRTGSSRKSRLRW